MPIANGTAEDENWLCSVLVGSGLFESLKGSAMGVGFKYGIWYNVM